MKASLHIYDIHGHCIQALSTADTAYNVWETNVHYILTSTITMLTTSSSSSHTV